MFFSKDGKESIGVLLKFLHEFATVAFRYRGVPDGFVDKLTSYYQQRRLRS